jgi:hypothetical protein
LNKYGKSLAIDVARHFSDQGVVELLRYLFAVTEAILLTFAVTMGQSSSQVLFRNGSKKLA